MVLDWQNTTVEMQAAHPDVAILPIGATEPGASHLPVGAITLILDTLARQVAQQLPWDTYLLPTLPMGTGEAHMGMPGALALEWRTLMHVLCDLVESLAAQGIQKVVLINGIGGSTASRVRPRDNYIVKATVRQLNYDRPSLNCIWLQPFTTCRDELKSIIESASEDVHAGELTTSLLLYLAPETVRSLGTDCVPPVTTEYLDWLSFQRLCPGGIWGRPSLASAYKGRRALELAVRASAAYIETTLNQLERIKRS